MSGRVDVFCAGVQKAGSTALFEYLSTHPGVIGARRKELHFFDDEAIDWRAPPLARLDASFADAGGDGGGGDWRLRLEATPIFSWWPPAMARIFAHNPAARIILSFRDPFERAWSQWCMEYARGTETLPFDQAIRAGRERMADLPPLHPHRRNWSYVERGYYGAQVQRVLAIFPRAQVHWLRAEDLRADPLGEMNRIAAFLELAPFAQQLRPRLANARPDAHYPSQPRAADRALLREAWAEDLRLFARLTGLDLSGWPCAGGEGRGRIAVWRGPGGAGVGPG